MNEQQIKQAAIRMCALQGVESENELILKFSEEVITKALKQYPLILFTAIGSVLREVDAKQENKE